MNGTSRLLKKSLQWLIPRLSLPLLVLNGWVLLLLLDYFKTPLSILLVGSVLAFLLRYPVGWLERRKIKRFPAILIILIIVLFGVTFLGVTLIPVLIKQSQSFSNNFGDWIKSFQSQIEILHTWLENRGISLNIDELFMNLGNHLSNQLQAISTHLPEFLQGALGSIFELFLIFVVTLYLLLEGESLWHGILEWLPLKFGRQLQISLQRSFQNYFIGQGTVGLIEGSVMTLCFLLFHIPYGFLFGIFIGFMVLFPFGGTIGVVTVTLLVTLKSIWLGLTVIAIATVVEQIVQNGIAPRLIGHLTGVHPVWVVMAILVGGKIAGLLGVLLAIPIASTIKDVMETYKSKRLETPEHLE